MTVIVDTRQDFSLEHVRRVAWGGEALVFGAKAKAKMKAARLDFMALVDDPAITIYGVNTGYGQHARNRLNAEQRKTHAQQPTHHRAASWGDPLPERVTRAMVFARLANFIEGHSAVSPHVAEAVAALLDGAPLPQVPSRGQGGAGEILSLSHLFLPLTGKIELAEKDMLALVNGSPAASALVADAALGARNRLAVASEVFALAIEAFNAPLGHFAAELENCWNNPHDTWALSTLRGHLAGVKVDGRRPYQAPVSIRILPRMLGEAHRAVEAAEKIASHSLMAVTDNPVVIPKGEQVGPDPVISTGGYHNAQSPAAMDALVAANVNLLVLAGRIAAKLLDGPVSLLPPFLGYNEGRSYLGCLPMAIVGYEEEARMLAQATLLPGSESGGFGQDDVASPVFLAWTKQERVGVLLELALATLAPIAVRALQITNRPSPIALKELAALTSQHFPDDDTTRPFGADVDGLAQAFRARIYAAAS